MVRLIALKSLFQDPWWICHVICIDMKINSALPGTSQVTSMAKANRRHSEPAMACHGQAQVPQISKWALPGFAALPAVVRLGVPAFTDYVATYRAVVLASHVQSRRSRVWYQRETQRFGFPSAERAGRLRVLKWEAL